MNSLTLAGYTMTKGKRVHHISYNPPYINSPSSSLITSPISPETADSGVIANTYIIDYITPENKQEMTSSL